MKLRVSHICFKNWKQKEKSEESANLKIDEFYAAEEIKKWGIEVLYKWICFIN